MKFHEINLRTPSPHFHTSRLTDANYDIEAQDGFFFVKPKNGGRIVAYCYAHVGETFPVVEDPVAEKTAYTEPPLMITEFEPPVLEPTTPSPKIPVPVPQRYGKKRR